MKKLSDPPLLQEGGDEELSDPSLPKLAGLTYIHFDSHCSLVVHLTRNANSIEKGNSTNFFQSASIWMSHKRIGSEMAKPTSLTAKHHPPFFSFHLWIGVIHFYLKKYASQALYFNTGSIRFIEQAVISGHDPTAYICLPILRYSRIPESPERAHQ